MKVNVSLERIEPPGRYTLHPASETRASVVAIAARPKCIEILRLGREACERSGLPVSVPECIGFLTVRRDLSQRSFGKRSVWRRINSTPCKVSQNRSGLAT